VHVLAEHLALLLLDHRQIHAATRAPHGAREVAGELGLQLVPLVDRVLIERLEPSEWGLIQTEGEVEALRVVVATRVFNGQGITPEPLKWVLLRVVLGDPERFEFLRKEQITKSCRVGGEAVAVADFSSLLGATNLVDPVAGIIAAVSVAGGVAVRVASASAVAATASSFAAVVGGATAAAALAAAALAATPPPPLCPPCEGPPTGSPERLGVGWCSPRTRLRPLSAGVRLQLVASWFPVGVTLLLTHMK
jgi:hypothetical protein